MTIGSKRIILASLACLLFVGACSKKQATESPTTLALPQSWIKESNVQSDSTAAQPSSEANTSVRSTLQIQASALNDAVQVPSTLSKQEIDKEHHPRDWTPWHIDGMIAAFGIDINGVFGALFTDGTPAIKVTWQQQNADHLHAQLKKNSALHFLSTMSPQDVAKMMEPIVLAAYAAKTVNDIPNLRKNLTAEGIKFLSLAKVLNSLDPLKGWHVDGYQMGLFFNASGEITPTNSWGAAASLIFDWQVSSPQIVNPSAPLSDAESDLRKQMTNFSQSLGAILSEAQAETPELRKSGFEFGVFQIGIGIVAGETIGIASAQESAVGRIIFKKNEQASTLDSLQKKSADEGIVPQISHSDSNIVRQIPLAQLKRGIQRAIKMSAFFARNGIAADIGNWKVMEIEAGFDATVTGDLLLATVGGTGLVRLGFERIP